MVAALAQGITLGALLQGIAVEGRAYAGGWWDWLTPFSLLTGASVVIAYALLGACWLIWKTEGALQEQMFRYARPLGIALIVAVGAVSLATPFLEGQYWQRWFSYPGIIATAPVPFLTAIAILIFLRALVKKQERTPFFSALAIFGLCLAGLGVSIWPDVVPGRISIWQAAAPDVSLSFMLVGAAIMFPIILGYTGWAYWVFRGKVGEGGYH